MKSCCLFCVKMCFSEEVKLHKEITNISDYLIIIIVCTCHITLALLPLTFTHDMALINTGSTNPLKGNCVRWKMYYVHATKFVYKQKQVGLSLSASTLATLANAKVAPSGRCHCYPEWHNFPMLVSGRIQNFFKRGGGGSN